MNAAEYWKLFLETGAPEAYLSYHAKMRMEQQDVSDGSRHCPEGIRLC